MSGQLGEKKVRMVFDTGCGLTLVDESFYNENRIYFSDLATQKGGVMEGVRTARILVPFTVAGHEFKDATVIVHNTKEVFGWSAPEIFLGMNHFRERDWKFDLQNFRYSAQ